MPAPLSLPPPPDDELRKSPLDLVVCQVRHERIAAVADATRALKIHSVLEDMFPKIEELSEETLNVAGGPSGVSVNRSEGVGGWRFKSADNAWTVSLTPTFFAIETSDYQRWEGFRGLLETLLRVVTEVTGPQIEQRLGLRFLDSISHPDAKKQTEFRGLIDDRLLGPLAGGPLSESIQATQNLVQLVMSGGVLINLRHGCSPNENGVVYRLDFDCFRESGQPFNPDGILTEADRLHDAAKQVFRVAITDDLYEYLEPVTQ